MFKKAIAIWVVILIWAGGATPLNALQTTSSKSSPETECQDMGDQLNGHSYRGFSFQRNKKNLEYTFQYRSEDDDLGVKYWRLYPLHEEDDAKDGDKYFQQGTTCLEFESRDVDGGYFYKPTSVKWVKIDRWKNGYPKKWNFEGTITKVRDEVVTLALVGFNSANKVVVFHQQWSMTGQRRGGTILGKLNGLACRIAVVGLPIAQGMYVIPRQALEGLNLAGVPTADKGLLTLEAFSISAGVDQYGRVKGSFGYKLDGGSSDIKKEQELMELAIQELIEHAAGEILEEVELVYPDTANVFQGGIFFAKAYIYLDDWQKSIEYLNESVQEAELDLCNYWD